MSGDILSRDSNAVPNGFNADKIQAVALEVAVTLPFVPGRHWQFVVTSIFSASYLLLQNSPDPAILHLLVQR